MLCFLYEIPWHFLFSRGMRRPAPAAVTEPMQAVALVGGPRTSPLALW